MSETSEPMVNVPLSAYDRLRDTVRTTQAENYALEAKLKEAQLADVSGTTKLLFDAFHAAMKVVQFAVGNLEPSTIAGWPHATVAEIAEMIGKIPGVDRHIGEMPQELRDFAKLAAGYEELRRQRDAVKVVLPATAADFGPKTPEAMAAHNARVASMSPPPSAPVTDDEEGAEATI